MRKSCRALLPEKTNKLNQKKLNQSVRDPTNPHHHFIKSWGSKERRKTLGGAQVKNVQWAECNWGQLAIKWKASSQAKLHNGHTVDNAAWNCPTSFCKPAQPTKSLIRRNKSLFAETSEILTFQWGIGRPAVTRQWPKGRPVHPSITAVSSN